MSDADKSKESWQERSKRMKTKLAMPFVYVEWRCEQLSNLLKQWAFLDILEYLGRFAILFVVVFYFAEAGDRKKAKHYQAWQVINSAQGKTGSGGRMYALQDLNGDDVSLAGVDISNATLRGINLEHANLREANFSGAHLYEANLSMTHLYKAKMSRVFLQEADLSGADLSHADLNRADLSHADLTGAVLYYANLSDAVLGDANLAGSNLYGADLGNITGWQSIKSIEFANIYGFKGSEGFEEWAIEHGAVSIENQQEWINLIREKMEEQKKQEKDN